MKPLFFVFLVISLCAPWTVQADESIGLEFPVEDARKALAEYRFVFVGIALADGVDLPGLDADQKQVVVDNYKVRLLNQRWESYTNIEERIPEFERMKAYGLRYNLAMWQGLRRQEIEQFNRYRY